MSIGQANPIVRPYRGSDDLRKMQALLADAYDQTDLRIGDRAWGVPVHTHRELSLDIRVWEDGTTLVGWTFFQSNGSFNFFAAPGAVTEALIDEMLATVEGMAGEALAAGDDINSLSTYGIVPGRSALDRALATGLARNGFVSESEGGGVLSRALTGLDEPSVPSGYQRAIVDTPERIIGRVEAHRAAFAPSEMTRKKYERMRSLWPYRQELDQIIETESGEVVAFCTAWIDEQNAAGLLEPVGTHPKHQRRGLACAACRAALIALRDAGAQSAQVVFATQSARALYESLGFTLANDDYLYTKSLAMNG